MVKKEINILMLPHNHEYIYRLKTSLENIDVAVTLLPPFHYATPINFVKVALLKLKGYNIVHIHWIYIFPFTFLMKCFVHFSKKLGYKLVWSIHNVLPHESTIKDIEKTKWLYEHVDYRFIHYKSNVKRIADVLQSEPRNIEIIYHPTFEKSYLNEIGRPQARERLGIPEDKKVFLCFGMIRKYKGMELFADAMEKLGGEYLGIIAGKGINENTVLYLKDIAKKTPNFMVVDRYIPDAEIQVFFNACDVVVLPYINVTTSGVALLAYSFHKPVITTNIGGMMEAVVDGETGLLIPPDDVAALVDAMKRIFTMNYEAMGENGYALAQERFSWEKLAHQTVNVYKEVLDIE